MRIIAPSVLSLDYSRLSESVQEVNDSKATWIHYDVMDGHFVPNLTFGPDILKGFSKMSNLFLDVHLMIEDPVKYAPIFIEAGADGITFHSECFDSVSQMIEFIDVLHAHNVSVGITSKPETDIETYKDVLGLVDLVLVMSVEPGFGGQSFQESALDKIRTFDSLRKEHGYNYLIQVDGGINGETAKDAVNAGVDVLVAGSYIFKDDINEKIEQLWNI